MKTHNLLSSVIFLLLVLLNNTPAASKSFHLRSKSTGHGLLRANHRKTQALRKKCYLLQQSLTDLDLVEIISEDVGTKVIQAANIADKAAQDEYLKLMSAEKFTTILDTYDLLGKGMFTYLGQPAWLLSELQDLVEKISALELKKTAPKEFAVITEYWNDLLKLINKKKQTAFLDSTKEAFAIISKASAALTAHEAQSKPQLTAAQEKLLSVGAQIVKQAKKPVDIFNNPTIIELEIKDPESANTVLKPMYEGISHPQLIFRMLRDWPEEFPLSDDARKILTVAAFAYNLNCKIQHVVNKMHIMTLVRAKKALREVSFQLMHLQETLNNVTDKFGPFKKTSDDLVQSSEPVIKDLEQLKKSAATLIKKLSEEINKQKVASKKITKQQPPTIATDSSNTTTTPTPSIAPITPVEPVVPVATVTPAEPAILPSSEPTKVSSTQEPPTTTSPISPVPAI